MAKNAQPATNAQPQAETPSAGQETEQQGAGATTGSAEDGQQDAFAVERKLVEDGKAAQAAAEAEHAAQLAAADAERQQAEHDAQAAAHATEAAEAAKIDVFVPRAFRINHPDGKVDAFLPGPARMTQEMLDHWYVQANGVVRAATA